MASEALLEKLNYTKAYRKTRLEVAHWVLEHPETLPELLEHCFTVKDDISYKAAWILEFVCIENLSLLYPYLDIYFEKLPTVYKDQAVRPLAKICEFLTTTYYKKKDAEIQKVLSEKHKETIVECCFDWLISNQKVACEVYAMQSLYYLGTEKDWIHSELITIIQANTHQRTHAYKARGKHILKQIEKLKSIPRNS
ncbi:hypothetical protein [Ulvibacter litoralis]|uniref:Adenylosuccinate lyase n=1 Tax=Ulvibacter litoralis TaxID=227084 RepID=A0A1G7F4E0_9FLAO|nr:hypothetical protein [Ulvibacter litoralis]GHC52717.1 hypothetical protein GCM10008083_15780 [Ulvibacter litoralis]SDE70759.1 hypothetical protein SAMN05421855_102324 [Ulvibacter litoralis]